MWFGVGTWQDARHSGGEGQHTVQRTRLRSWVAPAIVLAVMAALLPGGTATPAAAQTATVIEVTSTADDATGENDAECPHASTCTLRAAVEHANVEGGDVEIALPAGDYQLDHGDGSLVVDQVDALTLSGAGSGDDPTTDTVVDAGGEGQLGDRILTVDGADLTLEGLRLTGGHTADDGGAVHLLDGTLTTSDLAAVGNAASDGDGGAFYVNQSEAGDVSIHLSDSLLEANTAENVSGGSHGFGGAIMHGAFDGTSDFTAVDTEFLNNESVSTGGALYQLYSGSVDASTTLRDVTFAGNENDCCGGAINSIVGGDDAAIDFFAERVLFEDNGAIGGGCCGGAVWIVDDAAATWRFRDTTWRDNANDSTLGGALWISGDGSTEVEFLRNEFSGNRAVENGGAVQSTNAALTIVDSVFAGNQITGASGHSGAAIDVIGGPDNGGPALTAINTTFSGNTVNGGTTDDLVAGAVGISSADAEFHHVTFADNDATGGGDAIYLRDDDAQATLAGTVLAGPDEGSRCDSDGEVGTIVDSGGNVADDDSCGFDVSDVHDDLLLDELTQVDRVDGEAGTTWVHELLDGSPAIAAVAAADCLETDQRGALRPTDGLCSAGAWEADATVPEPETEACPPGVVPPAGFTDIAGSTHEAAIDCAAWYGITQGVTADLFVPRRATTRQEMASFIGRTLEVAGAQLPASPTHDFQDLTGGAHDERIAQLAEVGIIEGRTATRFVPRDHVTRAQTASLLVRAHDWLVAEALPPGESGFTDIAGSVHEDAIEAAASAELTEGRTSTTFAPQSSTSRDQVASFTTRLLQLFFEEGLVAHPG